MEQSRGQAFRLLAIIGPGILVAATGVGAGDLATGAFTGNKLGVAVLWAVLVGAFIKFVLNEGLARWQLVTGETLLEGTVRRIGWPVLIIFLPYLLLWSFFVGAALISACGVAMHAIVPVFDNPHHGKIVFGILHSLAGVFLVLKGGFILFRKIMLVCIGIMFLVVTSTAVLVCEEDWRLLHRKLEALLIPAMSNSTVEQLEQIVEAHGGQTAARD